MKHKFLKSPDNNTIHVETDLPAKYPLECATGVSRVRIIGPNTYAVEIQPGVNRDKFLRDLASTLRNA